MTYFSICLFFVLFLPKAACLKFKGGDFILLDGEPENLLYENTFVHEWLLCRVNTSVISPYEYTKKGYINENCSNKNWDNKHSYLKYAWFYAGVPDTEIPTCDPLAAAESYLWNCEKNLLPNEVTPYRNCTPVCNEGYTLLHNVTARCSVNLTWTWFGDKDVQFCEKTNFSAVSRITKPVIVGPVNQTVQTGSDARFECIEITKGPQHHTQWLQHYKVNGSYRDQKGQPYVKIIQQSMVNLSQQDILIIKNVTKDNAGWYTCVVSNQLGRDYQSAWLAVIDRHPSTTTSDRFSSATTSEGPSNTASTVSASSNETVWTVLDLTASHINETTLELTWKVSISPAGSHHYPINYTIFYNILGELTHNVTLKGYMLNTTISELEPDSKYFFKLCAKGSNEQHEICANTTVQTKGVLVKHHPAGVNYSVIFIVAGCCVLVLALSIVIIIGIFHVCKKEKYSPSYSQSSNDYRLVEQGSSNTQDSPSQSTSGGANCFCFRNKCLQLHEHAESSFSEENSSSTKSDSPDCPKKVQTNKTTKISESGDKLIAQDEKEAKNNNVQKRHNSCAESLSSNESSVTKNNYQIRKQKVDSVIIKCEEELKCGESNVVHTDFENQSNSSADEIQISIESSENSTMKTVEELQVSFNEAGEKVALLNACQSDTKISEKDLKTDESLEFIEGRRTEPYHQLDPIDLDYAPSLRMHSDFSDRPNDKTGHLSGLSSNFNLNRNDAHKTSHSKDLNVDDLHALDLPPGLHSAQPYAAAQFQPPVVNENFPFTPKPDSYDFNGSESLQPNHTSHSSKKPHRTSSSERKISTVGHVNLNHNISSSNRGVSSCDVDAMNNQISEPTVPVVSSASCIQGAKINNEASQYQTTEDDHVRDIMQNETIDYRLFEPTLTLPNTQHIGDENDISHLSTSNRDNEDILTDRSQRDDSLHTGLLHTCISSSNTTDNAEKVLNLCTTSVSGAMNCLKPAFFKDLGYFLDPHSNYGNEKSWYGLTLAVLGLPEEKVKSISHHTKGNPEVGHFLATLEYYVAEEKHLSDIVQYFIQPHSLRMDVIQYFKKHHKDCAVCNTLYLTVPHGRDISNSTEDVRKVSASHHKGS
ncbi:uncharacterized protein LOC134697337 [Mytilus trossulus]|uniref:uncharacterized protein LOC134697337 n=1 Tax=Mytilus trossulus TaxID=6551 RepID=UPI003007CC43